FNKIAIIDVYFFFFVFFVHLIRFIFFSLFKTIIPKFFDLLCSAAILNQFTINLRNSKSKNNLRNVITRQIVSNKLNDSEISRKACRNFSKFVNYVEHILAIRLVIYRKQIKLIT